MSGFVLWHKVTISTADAGGGLLGAVASAFGFGLPLTVSNSVYGLGLLLDADVTITAREGATATTFSVTFYDLPAKDTETLKAANHDGALRITISLGYLDDPRVVFGDHPVLRGRVSNIYRPSDVAGVYGAAGAGLAVGRGARDRADQPEGRRAGVDRAAGRADGECGFERARDYAEVRGTYSSKVC